MTGDPFAVLGLPRSFDLTPADVAAAHLRACARSHPDRARDPFERDRLLAQAAEAGDAKRILSNPVSRAEALLALAGVPAGDEPLSPAFLFETLELREAIEDASAAPGGVGERLGALRAQVDALLAAATEDLRVALGACAAGDAAAGRAARGALARLRYAQRMSTRIAEAL